MLPGRAQSLPTTSTAPPGPRRYQPEALSLLSSFFQDAALASYYQALSQRLLPSRPWLGPAVPPTARMGPPHAVDAGTGSGARGDECWNVPARGPLLGARWPSCGGSRARCAAAARAAVVPSGRLCLHLPAVPFPSQFNLTFQLNKRIILLPSRSVLLRKTQESKGTTVCVKCDQMMLQRTTG